MDIHSYLDLAQLARRRLESYAQYLAFQRQQARMLSAYLKSRGVTLQGRRVLDLGSGLGGYALEWQAAGGTITTLDLSPPSPAVRAAGIAAAQGNAQRLPFAGRAFDVVFCASLIEHVTSPAQLLAEIKRVLRPGGICYLSFPPYYSPRGGHEFSPYHYLGERWAHRLARREKKVRAIPWLQDYYEVNLSADGFSDTFKGWGLHPVTIAEARRWVREAGFKVRDFSTRYSPVNFAAIPVLGEVLAWHVQFILER